MIMAQEYQASFLSLRPNVQFKTDLQGPLAPVDVSKDLFVSQIGYIFIVKML